MRIRAVSLSAIGAGIVLSAGTAAAHVEVASGPGIADTSQEVAFAVGHGCEGADTLKVTVEIPSDIASVRTVESTFGPASISLNDAGLPVSVTWEKPEASLLESDTNYYKLALRFRVPNSPFTTLYFPTHQVCQRKNGETLEVDWVGEVAHDDESSDVEPAPALTILPKHFAGWNQFTVPGDIHELAAFFSDALIVWKDDAAFSANPTTAELIASTPGVDELTELEEGDEIWVKY